jgi:alpha-tubulin suppressor-like RCC1 family protein
VQVTGVTGVTKIAAGLEFSLALRSDGTVWSWGLGNQGQLGNAGTFDSAVPVQTWMVQATSIAAGWDAAYAIRSNSAGATAWSWGGDTCGDLGLGTTATGATPMVTIPQPVIGITTPSIVQVSASQDYALALGSDGKVWGWGADKPGSQVSYRCSVTAEPVVAAGSGITQLSASLTHVLALAGGIVIAWGDNFGGELGIGSTAPVTGTVHVANLSGVTQVASGTLFSLAVYSQSQGTALAAAAACAIAGQVPWKLANYREKP